MIYLLTAIG